jgi:hypothetical protein
VLFLLEADDMASRAAFARQTLPPGFEVLVVPAAQPRTKPKALTFALPFARGDLVVVFDAEDRPQPDQLRKAAAAFHERPSLGCVQARLAPDNLGSWFARMFTVEYAANFEVLLPALSSWRVPLPLGGTSNHFPRVVLEAIGGWDPYNVTEDADLGVRLARIGYPTATILSRTYEEAPIALSQWLAQRRRWIKGWIQTAMLCLGGRAGGSLRLPLRQRLAVHAILTGGVLGLLLYPISLSLIFIGCYDLAEGIWPGDAEGWLLLGLNCGNLVAILAAASISAWRGLSATGRLHLAWHIPYFPVYWALMSFAAWRALYQFFRDPSGWEKTAHGVAPDRATPANQALLI